MGEGRALTASLSSLYVRPTRFAACADKGICTPVATVTVHVAPYRTYPNHVRSTCHVIFSMRGTARPFPVFRVSVAVLVPLLVPMALAKAEHPL